MKLVSHLLGTVPGLGAVPVLSTAVVTWMMVNISKVVGEMVEVTDDMVASPVLYLLTCLR